MRAADAPKAIEELKAAGWYIKVATATLGPDPGWKVWLSWRQGPPPHKEASQRCATLAEVAEWCKTTAENWIYEED